MGGFDAALKVGNDSRPLSTRVHVEDGRLSISTGDQTLGEWPMSDLDLERVAGGYRMEVEGEQLILDVSDLLGFQQAIEANRPQKTRKLLRPRSKSEAPTNSRPQSAPAPKPKTGEPEPPRAKPGKAPRETPAQGSFVSRSLARLDDWLERGKQASGSDWPDWIFSRWTVGGLLGLVVFAIVFPGLFSTFFLLGGLAFVILGAVLYTDDAMARRWLPGRLTALHVLISGTGLAVLGVLVAVVRG